MKCQRPHCNGRMLYDRQEQDWTCLACGRGTFVPMPEVKLRREYQRGAQWYHARGMEPRSLLFDISAIQKDRADGLNLKQIAFKHGCSISHAQRLCKKEVRE